MFKTDLKDFAGLWVALTEQDTVGGVGRTVSDAVHAARIAWPKERLRIVLVSEHPPHLPLPAWPLKLLRTLSSDTKVWLVGGAVRDLLLGLEPDDWDFVVADDAVKLARKVADHMQGDFYILDAERGTGRAIATPPYQTRLVHLDFAEVRGASIEEDLYIRDFTINAIAMTVNGRLFDPTGGIEDLRENRLSMVRPDTLSDDPVRLLRAMRLSYQLNLSLDEKTSSAVRILAPKIVSVAEERIQAELTKLLKVPDPDQALAALKHYDLLPYLFPEVSSLPSDQWKHTLLLVQVVNWLSTIIHDCRPRQTNQTRVSHTIPHIPSWVDEDLCRFIGDLGRQLIDYLDEEINSGLSRDHLLRWAALLHAVESDALSTDLGQKSSEEDDQNSGVVFRCKMLRLPKDATDVIKSVVRCYRDPEALVAVANNRRSIYRYFQQTSDHGLAIIWFSLAHYLANSATKPHRHQWRQTLKAARRCLRAYFLYYTEIIAPAPLLGGHDLIEMGMRPGPKLGSVLRWLVESQAAGEIRSRDQAVDEVSRRYLSSYSPPTATDGDTQ